MVKPASTCPRGHALGSVEGCWVVECLRERLNREAWRYSDQGIDWRSAHAAVLRAALDAQAKWVRGSFRPFVEAVARDSDPQWFAAIGGDDLLHNLPNPQEPDPDEDA